SGGFPSIPRLGGTELDVYVHPAPKFTCAGCTGGADAIDLAQAPAGAPLFSYSKRTYTANSSFVPFNMWGKISSMKMSVTTPYTGTQSSPHWYAASAAIKADGSSMIYNPSINLKVAGERDVTPSSVTAPQVGDSGLSVPEAIWLSDTMQQALDVNI